MGRAQVPLSGFQAPGASLAPVPLTGGRGVGAALVLGMEGQTPEGRTQASPQQVPGKGSSVCGVAVAPRKRGEGCQKGLPLGLRAPQLLGQRNFFPFPGLPVCERSPPVLTPWAFPAGQVLGWGSRWIPSGPCAAPAPASCSPKKAKLGGAGVGVGREEVLRVGVWRVGRHPGKGRGGTWGQRAGTGKVPGSWGWRF